MSSRMGHLEKEKLSPAGTCRMGSELAVCHSMASGWSMSGAVLYLLAAGTSRLQWGHGTEPSSSLGGSSAQSHPGQYAVAPGWLCPRAAQAVPVPVLRWRAGAVGHSRAGGAGRAGGSRGRAQGGRGCPGQAVPGRKQPMLGFPWVPALVVPLWSPTGRRCGAEWGPAAELRVCGRCWPGLGELLLA